MLSLHDSARRTRVPFQPADPAHVRMYVCGPTVYDLPHLGNVRSTVVFDVLARLLRALYPRVTYVRNITDVEDKITARAAENNESIDALTARTAAEYQADMAAIGNLPPDIEPRATGHIAEMITLIGNLVGAGHAYEASGHVLFDVPSFPAYGTLSGRSPEDLLAGARVETAPYKKNQGDFVLWKPSAPEQPGWASPWGFGRPGWHIECSAMSWRYLGQDFDIHGGGSDLLFPHHENERAQSLCAFPGAHFARVWLHNGMLQVNGEKMSKSLGNFFTLRDVLARAPAELIAQAGAIRLLILRTQYRALLDFTDAALAEARQELDRFYRALERTPPAGPGTPPRAFMEALCDDLNTPGAIAVLRTLADAALTGDAAAAADLRAAGALLGLLQRDPDEHFGRVLANVVTDATVEFGTPEQINAAIAERLAARRAKDYARADAIRNEWLARKVIMEDGPGGTTWRRA